MTFYFYGILSICGNVDSNVVDPNTLNLDPDPGFWLNLNPDTGPGLYYQF